MATDLGIQNAFLDGMEEVYQTLFTEEIDFAFLDEESTKTNIYGEACEEKSYCEPIRLIGKVNTDFKQGELPVEGVHIDCKVTIPTKQLITNKIPRESQADLEKLRKGKFSYKGYDYLVTKIEPRTLIANEWHFYVFYCYVDTNSSLKVEEPLGGDELGSDNEEDGGLAESGSNPENAE